MGNLWWIYCFFPFEAGFLYPFSVKPPGLSCFHPHLSIFCYGLETSSAITWWNSAVAQWPPRFPAGWSIMFWVCHCWKLYGESILNLWWIYGKSMVNLWWIYGDNLRMEMGQPSFCLEWKWYDCRHCFSWFKQPMLGLWKLKFLLWIQSLDVKRYRLVNSGTFQIEWFMIDDGCYLII